MSTEPTAAELLRQAFERAKRRHGATQVTIASQLGVKQQTVSNWLNGTREPSATDFARFLRACRAPQSVYLAVANMGPDSPGYLNRGTFDLAPVGDAA